MADYNKVFDGAARDAANANVIASEWDPEYNSIQNAIATKSNKIVVPTNGNLIEQDGTGDIQDAGIDPTNLDQTSPIQTQLDGKVNSEGGDIDANHFQAGNFQVWDGARNSGNHVTGLDLFTNINSGNWHEVGPTTSSAPETWDEMDALPSSARALIVGIRTTWQMPGAGLSSRLELHFNGVDDTPAIGDRNLAAHVGIDYPFPIGIKFVDRWANHYWIPLTEDQTFFYAANSLATSLQGASLYYWGFITE